MRKIGGLNIQFVDEGDFFKFIGPRGFGKTTLAKWLYKSSRAIVHLDCFEYLQKNQDKEVGFSLRGFQFLLPKPDIFILDGPSSFDVGSERLDILTSEIAKAMIDFNMKVMICTQSEKMYNKIKKKIREKKLEMLADKI